MQQVQRLVTSGLATERYALHRNHALKKLRFIGFPWVQLLGGKTVSERQVMDSVLGLVSEELVVEFVRCHIEHLFVDLLPGRRSLTDWLFLELLALCLDAVVSFIFEFLRRFLLFE